MGHHEAEKRISQNYCNSGRNERHGRQMAAGHGGCGMAAAAGSRHSALLELHIPAVANAHQGAIIGHSFCVQVKPAHWCQEPSANRRICPEECHDVFPSEDSVCSNFNRLLCWRRCARHGIDAWAFLFTEYNGRFIANRGSRPSPSLQASWTAIWPRLSPPPPRYRHLYCTAARLCSAPRLCRAASLPPAA